MKNTVNRIAVAILMGLTVAAVVILSVFGVAAAEPTAGASYGYSVPMSFEGEDNFNKLAMLNTFTGEIEMIQGLCRFVTLEDGTECIKLDYHKYKDTYYPSYRMMPSFYDKDVVTMDHKYVRVTYMTTDKEAHAITLKNNANRKFVTLVPDASVSGGKFVTSEPVDISVMDGNQRYVNGMHCTVGYESTSENSVIYIKDILFFTTLEQANAYDPNVGIEIPAQLMERINNKVTKVDYITVEEPAKDISAPKVPPIIMSFEGEDAFAGSFARFNTFTGNIDMLQGDYEFVTLSDGAKALKLKHHVYMGEGKNIGYADFRMAPAFKSSGMVTAEHKYMRVTFMTTDTIPRSITLVNNADTSKEVTLVSDTSYSKGAFVRSNPVNISDAGLTARYANGLHCSFEFNSSDSASEIYIKEIGLFATADQAYEYYGDSFESSIIDYSELSFGLSGNSTVDTSEERWGKSEETLDTVDIVYDDSTELKNIYYMAMVRARSKGIADPSKRYIRVLYSADNPDDAVRASMYLRDGKMQTVVLLSDNVTDTNGRFVLSPAAYITDNMASRFTSPFNCVFINPQSEGGRYRIKAIYMFSTREEAEAFTVTSSDHTLSVNGNDISQYRIVVSADAPDAVMRSTEVLVSAVSRITGIKLPVVTDDAPVSEYEILVGDSNRPASTVYPNTEKIGNDQPYNIFVCGNYLVINSEHALSVPAAVDDASRMLFYSESRNIPEEINIPADLALVGYTINYRTPDYWESGAPVEAPTVFTETFDSDNGYFNEDNGEDNWKYEGGAYKTNAKDYASSYLHVYEKNVTYKAKLSYTSENGGVMGIAARVNSTAAYVKAGYDFAKGEWYIESRDGADFYNVRTASQAAVLTKGAVYELVLDVMDDTASLRVNGETVISDARLTHASPGRIAVYAEDASVSVDDVEVTLVSGQGTVWKNVVHTKLPDDEYREGGTVMKTADGALTYMHHSGATYKSFDNGITWSKADMWTDKYGDYVNIYRLNNGEIMRIMTETVGGKTYKVSRVTSDEGASWSEASIICDGYYENTRAHASNMNDKIFQSPTTDRIFYCVTYDFTFASESIDGRNVFCRFYYSDDNGATWTKSETDSWEIPGNEDHTHFSECKMLECADGTIRVYCSWNYYGHIVYADSKDGGKTFGELQHMEEYRCSASSMQFVRDPYADNNSTYYMVWVNGDPASYGNTMPRYRLSLAKTEDGKNWVYLGDVWRWESSYGILGTVINQIVDPFIYVTEEYVICGSGFSEHTAPVGESSLSDWHQAQRQHIYSIRKDTLPEGKRLNRFTDVTYGSSAYEAVTFVTEAGLFQGTGETAFAPGTTMNRAMFVTVLGRQSGVDVSEYAKPTFCDVAVGQWYTAYVEWAAANGIVNGLGNGLYGINDPVTVQQACVILARYAGFAAAVDAVADGDAKTTEDFSDGAAVASWAKNAVDWAIANDIYTGTAGKLDPEAHASRALVAIMFNNYVKAFGR